MKYPVCGAAELIHDPRDIPYCYKGETILLKTNESILRFHGMKMIPEHLGAYMTFLH